MRVKLTGIEEDQLKKYLVMVTGMKKISEARMKKLIKISLEAETEEKRDDAKKELIEAYLKVVISISAKYRGAGLSFARLLRAGNKGLINALKKFDESQSKDLMSHIVWHVEGSIIKELIKSKKVADRKR